MRGERFCPSEFTYELLHFYSHAHFSGLTKESHLLLKTSSEEMVLM